jgi:hypothetical protein
MPPSPTPLNRVKNAQRRLKNVRALREAQVLERRAELLEGALPTQLDWITAYATLVDRLRSEPYSYNVASPFDRKFGRNFPIYQTEQDLAILRAPARVLCQANTYAQALLEGLTSYVIGPGFMYRAAGQRHQQAPVELVEAVQAVVDRFLWRNQWNNAESWGDLETIPEQSYEEEFFGRSLRDGETTALHTVTEAGETDVRFVEPEFITQPPGARWQEWSFGWKTPENDEQRKLAAWVSWTGNPADGEEIAIENLVQMKRNSDRIAKRGVPDFAFDASDALTTAQRLRRALAVGAAQKACIVGVRQHKGQTQGQVQSFADALADFTATDLVTGQQRNVRQYSPGEWEDLPENLEYVPGPAAGNEAALVEVLTACLRGAVVRWNGFEWLISADSSSNSYANAMAAESPAVKRVLREQARYRACFLRSVTIAVRNAALAGAIRALGRTWSWEEVRTLVEVQIEAPNPEVRDPLQLAQANALKVQAGWKSRQTVMQEEGLDVDREIENMDAWHERFGPEGPPLELPPAAEKGADKPPSAP